MHSAELPHYAVRPLAADELERVFEIDRTERIDARYVPRLADDGSTLRAELQVCDPPEVFPDWDAEGRRRRGRWYRRELDAGGSLLAFEEAGRIAGFALRGSVDRTGSAEIVAMFVDAAHRGQGIGRALLAALEADARAAGAAALHSGVNLTVRTVRFYQRAGYRIVALVDESLRAWQFTETAIVMARLLTD